jgi:hypothetical protein
MTMPNSQIETNDTTISDLHAIREELSDRFGGDIRAILADARHRQTTSGRPVLPRGALEKSKGLEIKGIGTH